MSPGQTYVVTGASRGLGFEFVRQLAASGNTVFALVRNPDSAEKLKTLVNNKTVYTIKMDANDEESIKAAAVQVLKLSPEGIDVLINNAGIDVISDVNTVTKAEFLKVFETNVCGANDTLRYFVPLLRQRGQDKLKIILNISSILGSIELTNREIDEIRPNVSMASYNASKAALNMLVKMWSEKLENENFVVYSSHPGWVKTDMGTEYAPVEIVDSIAGQLSVLKNLTVADNGHFYDYRGRTLAW